MPSPIVLDFPAGQTFSDITSLALIGGVAWGSCNLCVSALDLSPETLRSTGHFADITNNPEEAWIQYCRLDRRSRERIQLPMRSFSKNVYGLAIGLSVGGPVGSLARTVEYAAISSARFLVRRFTSFVAARAIRLVSSAIEDVASAVSSGGTVGTSGGFLNMFDGGALHGLNGNNTLELDVSAIGRMNYCVLQLSGGCIAGAGVNLLLVGRFPSLWARFTQAAMGQFLISGGFNNPVNVVTYMGDLLGYCHDIFSEAYCFAIIGDAQFGLVLPGVDINIIAS